jgi:hypothetical protein
VLSGFSGRATRLLAKTLANRGDEFWPPVFEEGGVKIGAYIVQYEDDPAGSVPSHSLLQTHETAAAKITPLPAKAIARRMARL